MFADGALRYAEVAAVGVGGSPYDAEKLAILMALPHVRRTSPAPLVTVLFTDSQSLLAKLDSWSRLDRAEAAIADVAAAL